MCAWRQPDDPARDGPEAHAGIKPPPGDGYLALNGVSVHLPIEGRSTPVVQDIAFDVGRGDLFALIGESGSGKSVTCSALLGILPDKAVVTGSALLGGSDLLERRPAGRSTPHPAMIFQNPTQSLNPVRTIGFQLVETLRRHRRLTRRQARSAARDGLADVGLDRPDRLMRSYPHHLSGGMNQRVMIALALAMQPALLVADEPTSALDVTTQRQILDLIDTVRRRCAMTVLLVTHDLSVALERADRVGVLYAGHLVECGPADTVLGAPRHPYTASLMAALPKLGAASGRIEAPEGQSPAPGQWPAGCRFAPRCSRATRHCHAVVPPEHTHAGRRYSCHHPLNTVS